MSEKITNTDNNTNNNTNNNTDNNTNNDNTNVEENYEFGVEVPQLMSMFVNSVYSSKDLFLREAVSNASDALTKMYKEKDSLTNEGYKTDFINNFKVEIIPNKENKTLIIRDNGIGMTKADLKNYLGCIANSGTAKFREMIANANSSKKNDDLIGQFGLGFYSYFLVADKVDVITKNPRDKAYLWSSQGKSNYTIKEYEYDSLHGTSVIIHLKEGEEEFLNTETLKKLIKKHSNFLPYPIALHVEKEVEVDTNTDNNTNKDNDKDNNTDNLEPKVEEVNKDEKVVKKKIMEMQIINSDVSVWNKKVEESSEEDLKKFYKQISEDYDDYAAVESFHFEGIVDLKLLLFIPKRAKMNFFEKPSDKANNFKIYNNNVFITDSIDRSIVPEWMSFITGAVTSSDFSLNISREFLQGKSALNILKTKLPKCIATMIKNLDEEKFMNFYKEFGRNIKIAVRETSDNIQKLYSQFLRYPTNLDSKLISLSEYCEKISENDKQILYLTGLNLKEVQNSLYLDAFKDKNVLLMSDASDEIMLQGFKKYNGLDFQNISAEGVEGFDLEQTNDNLKEFKEHCQKILENTTEKVIISKRFKTVPASILTTKHSHSSTMEAIMRSHPNAENDMMMQMMLKTKKIFELNADNLFVKNIIDLYESKNLSKVEEYIKFLYDSTAVCCGFNIENKTDFIRTLFKVISDKDDASKNTEVVEEIQ